MTITIPKNLSATLAFVVVLAMLGLATGAPARADPMKCSGEEKTCNTACSKTARGVVTACLTRCGASKAYCLKTGCWIYGAQNYCGLSKQ